MRPSQSRVLASPTTPFACLVEPGEVTVLDGLEPIAEVGVACGADVALVGNHLVVLCPEGQLFVVDPRHTSGPKVIGSLEIGPDSRIKAATNRHLLVELRDGPAIVDVSDRGDVVLARLPSRVKLDLCASAGFDDHFLIACGDVIEEWSASSRSPMRRFHLGRALAPTHIGGTSRHIWAVAGEELVSVKRDGTASPSRISLPEPPASASSDGRGGVAIVGSSSGRAWIVRIAERTVTPLCDKPVREVAIGRDDALILDADGAPAQVSYGATKPSSATDTDTDTHVVPCHDALAAWKARAVRTDWRDDLVAWMRRGAPPSELPVCPPVREVAARLAIDTRDIGVLLACYGARLCGHDGATFADLVEQTPKRWTEILGRGSLRNTGALLWYAGRVHLAPELVAIFDETAPVHGVLHDGERTAASLRRVVAPGDADLDTIAAWAAPTVGALLAPSSRGLQAPTRFLIEARARGVAPLVPWRRATWSRFEPQLRATNAIVVVEDSRVAPALGPISLCWPASIAAA